MANIKILDSIGNCAIEPMVTQTCLSDVSEEIKKEINKIDKKYSKHCWKKQSRRTTRRKSYYV